MKNLKELSGGAAMVILFIGVALLTSVVSVSVLGYMRIPIPGVLGDCIKIGLGALAGILARTKPDQVAGESASLVVTKVDGAQ